MLTLSFISKLYQRSKQVVRPKVWLGWYRRWGTFPIWCWIHGARQYSKGNFRAAAEFYKRGLDKYPNHVASHCARFDYAYCLFKLNEWDDSQEQLQILIDEAVNIKDVYLLDAEMKLYTGHAEKAADTLRKAYEVIPNDTRLMVCRAFALIESDGDADELSFVRDGLVLAKNTLTPEQPERILIETALANFELNYGDRDYGEQMLNRIVSSGNAPAEALVMRAQRYVTSGYQSTALRLFQRASSIAPTHPAPYAELAKCYIESDNPLQKQWAITAAETACKLSNWKNINHLYTLVEAYRESGDGAAAILLMRRIKELSAEEQLDMVAFQALERKVEALQALAGAPTKVM